MRLRVTLSILLNLVAVAAPGAVLLLTFGPTAQVDPQSAKDLLYLLGSAVFVFALALGSGAFLRGADKPAIISQVEDLFPRGGRRGKSV
jgi:hypothetical protein